MYCTDYWLNNFYVVFIVFIPFYMHFAGAPPDEPLGETDCCGFNVYGVVVQIDKLRFRQVCC